MGSLASGKSALVHRYLTGSYMQEESPEGGRFKKEISVDGQSYLLLIRDEGGSPELQVLCFCRPNNDDVTVHKREYELTDGNRSVQEGWARRTEEVDQIEIFHDPLSLLLSLLEKKNFNTFFIRREGA